MSLPSLLPLRSTTDYYGHLPTTTYYLPPSLPPSAIPAHRPSDDNIRSNNNSVQSITVNRNQRSGDTLVIYPVKRGLPLFSVLLAPTTIWITTIAANPTAIRSSSSVHSTRSRLSAPSHPRLVSLLVGSICPKLLVVHHTLLNLVQVFSLHEGTSNLSVTPVPCRPSFVYPKPYYPSDSAPGFQVSFRLAHLHHPSLKPARRTPPPPPPPPYRNRPWESREFPLSRVLPGLLFTNRRPLLPFPSVVTHTTNKGHRNPKIIASHSVLHTPPQASTGLVC